MDSYDLFLLMAILLISLIATTILLMKNLLFFIPF